VPRRDLLIYHWFFWKKSFKGNACIPGVVRGKKIRHDPDTRRNVDFYCFLLSLLFLGWFVPQKRRLVAQSLRVINSVDQAWLNNPGVIDIDAFSLSRYQFNA
jgi:hypothetical protein